MAQRDFWPPPCVTASRSSHPYSCDSVRRMPVTPVVLRLRSRDACSDGSLHLIDLLFGKPQLPCERSRRTTDKRDARFSTRLLRHLSLNSRKMEVLCEKLDRIRPLVPGYSTSDLLRLAILAG